MAETPDWMALSMAAYGEKQEAELKARNEALEQARLIRVKQYTTLATELSNTLLRKFGLNIHVAIPHDPRSVQEAEFKRTLHVKAKLPGDYWLFYGQNGLAGANVGKQMLYALALPTPEAYALDNEQFPEMLYELSHEITPLSMGEMLVSLQERRAKLDEHIGKFNIELAKKMREIGLAEGKRQAAEGYPVIRWAETNTALHVAKISKPTRAQMTIFNAAVQNGFED